MADTIEKILEIPSSILQAENIKYNNTESKLTAENVQGAIEEVQEATKTADTVTGTNPTITNSTDGNVTYLKNSGYTEQKTLSGKNLLNVVGNMNNWQCTVSIADDGKITIKNTATSGVVYARLGTITFKKGKVYTISLSAKSNLKHVTFFNAGTSNLTGIYYSSENKTFNITEDITVDVGAYMEDVSTVGNTTSLYIQIEEGSVATDYEPYCGGISSPNPSYPQEIKGLGDGGTIDVKTRGKNLLKNTATTKTSGGVTFTVNEDGTITLNGTATTDINYDFNWNIDATKKSVLASIHKISGSASSDSNISFLAYDSRWWGAYGPSINSVERKLNNYEFVIFRIQVKKDTVCTNLKVGLMVRYETITDGTYEPYTETQALIPISAPLYDGDYIEIFADGSGMLYRENGVVDYAASWYVDTTVKPNAYRYSFGAKVISQSDAHSTHFPCYPTRSMYNYALTFDAFSTNESKLSACTYNANLNTLAKWKQWLQDNDVKFVYKLKTPTTQSLTADQVAEFMKLQTFKGVTHINADGEVTIRYYCNNDSGELVNMIQNEIKNNIYTKKETDDKIRYVALGNGSYVAELGYQDGDAICAITEQRPPSGGTLPAMEYIKAHDIVLRNIHGCLNDILRRLTTLETANSVNATDVGEDVTDE